MAGVYDVLIVGNGILAETLIFKLQRKNSSLKVAIIGRRSRLGSASKAAGAMINAWCELTPNHLENPLLEKRFQVTRRGAESWTNFAKEISEITAKKIEVKRGTFLILTQKSTEFETNSFRYIAKKVRENNIEHQKILASDLPWLESSCDVEAIYIKDDGYIDSRLALKSLDLANKKLGVEIFDDEVTELKLKKSSREIVTKSGAKFSAKNIVLANGSFAQALLDQNPEVAREIPRLFFGIGSGLDFSLAAESDPEILKLDAVVRTADRGNSCSFHLIPYGNGKFYAGASSLLSPIPDFAPTAYATQSVLDSLINEINGGFAKANIAFRGVGFRPTSADTFPLLGETNVKGLWMLNGTKRDGFTMSAYLSEQLAKNILGETHELPQEFKPCRKLISYKNKEHAIKDAELMHISADAQHGGIGAPYAINKRDEMRHNEIVKIYDRRNLGDFGIHPELLHLYDSDEFYAKMTSKNK